MSPKKNPKTENITTDIVIVGGGSGLSAAVAAAEMGAKVTIVEQHDFLGGNSLISGAFFACESPVQKRMGIDAPRDYFFKYSMDWAHWKSNPRLVRAFINKTGDTVGWLEKKGVKFEQVTASAGLGRVRCSHRPATGVPGGAIMRALIKDAEKLGVKVFYRATAKKILTDAKGNVTGIVATTGGKELNIKAKATIICTGGYPTNKKLIKKYNPNFSEDSLYVGIPDVDGDGLQMALEVGAATEGLGYVHYMGWHYKGSPIVSRVCWDAEPVWINRNGERFCDECVVFDMGTRGNAIERQPGRMGYILLDEKLKGHLIEEHKGQVVRTESHPEGFTWDNLTKDLQTDAKTESVKIARSWAEIARWIGIAPEVLKATVDEYNSFCDKGYDETFLKDHRYLLPLTTPPFYALKCYSDYPCTMGGVRINYLMQIVNKEDKPILGLYCCGTDAGGWESETYCYHLFGDILSWRVNSGRMAGESAAKYVLKK